MRIGIFTDSYPPQINGVATVSALLNKVFKEHGHEVYVITVSNSKLTQPYEVNGNIIGISSKAIKNLYNYRWASIYPRIAARFLASLNLDIIHVQTELTIGIFARLLAKIYSIPIVYTYHTTYEDYTYYVTKGNVPFDKFAKKVVAAFSKTLGNNSTEFTTTSEKTKDLLKTYGVTNFINVIPNGLDLSLFLNKDFKEEIIQYKKDHDLENKFICLLLGRLAQEKSFDVVLKNINAYIQKTNRDDIRVLVVGSGPAEEDLKKIVEESNLKGYVEFLGFVPYERTAFYYYLSDLFISASLTETQGLTFIEAMASGLPVLARFDECLSGVIEDKVNGFFYNTEDEFIKSFDYFFELSEDDKKFMKEKAKSLVVDKYSSEKYYHRMLDVYNRALRKCW